MKIRHIYWKQLHPELEIFVEIFWEDYFHGDFKATHKTKR